MSVLRRLVRLVDPPDHLTTFGAWRLMREAERRGFYVAKGRLRRNRWYLSVRHKTIVHWAFVVLSRRQWEERVCSFGQEPPRARRA